MSQYQIAAPFRRRMPRPYRGGTIWNVWEGEVLLGIVNEPFWPQALEAANVKWSGHMVQVIEAAVDPFRRRSLVRSWVLDYLGLIH